MSNHDDLVLLYTGTEINAKVLKDILEDNKIGAMIKNDMKSGLSAGFGGGYMETAANLYVAEKNLEKAQKLLNQFLESLNKKED